MRRPAALLALLIPALLPACAMQRSVTIDSTPSGAHIWVNGVRQEGTTPVTVPFSQYGFWDVRLEKQGYASVATRVQVASQLDGYPVVDLPFEILGGARRFRRVIPMTPLATGDPEARAREILRDAQALRDATRRAVEEPGTPERQAPEFLR